MKIAICDDEPNFLTQLERMVLAEMPSAVVQSYLSASTLLQEWEHAPYDLIFMDIEMPSPNGFDAARRLQKLSHPPLIVFVTRSGDYAIRGYGVAFRYLKKPITSEDVSTVLSLAAETMSSEKLVVQTKAETLLIPFCDIRFIEVADHQISISAGPHTVSYHGTMGSLLSQLPDLQFAQPHSSFVVNLHYVRSVTANHVTLTDGSSVPLSQRRRRAFESALFQFVRR